MTSDTALIDLGERKIVNEIIARFVANPSDDCAVTEQLSGRFLITTDPVPVPAAAAIGRDEDPYWCGWLLVVINASDLAACGAVPVGFVAAIEVRNEMSAADLKRLLAGVADACSMEGLRYMGGNIKEGSSTHCVGTAFGLCSSSAPIGRSGARPDQVLISVGAGGVFWRR